MGNITEKTRLPFGKHKGRSVASCPTDYLRWMLKNLFDTDFHEFACVAGTVVARRDAESKSTAELEESADEFLRRHGVDPKSL